MALVTTAIQKIQSGVDDALPVLQARSGTNLVSMGLVGAGAPWAVQELGPLSEYADKDAGDWKDLRICDKLCQRICAPKPRWL